MGIKIGPIAETDVIQINYVDKIKAMEKKLSPWMQKGLTPYGRVYLIKSEGISQLNYLLSVLPEPSSQMMKKIETIIFKFIWGYKKDRIKRSVMKNNYEVGGLKVPDIAATAKSFKIAWVKRYFEQTQPKWKHIVHPQLTVDAGLTIFEKGFFSQI